MASSAEKFARQVLGEAFGDNIVDNLVDELRSATEKELKMFVADILTREMKTFAVSYMNPHFDAFGKIVQDLVERYNVMDQEEKGDLFTKIENMFADIFVKEYSDLGPEAAKVSSSFYALQMQKYLKANEVQANVDIVAPRRQF